MNQIKNNIRKGFTICPNELINDEAISRDARFLFVWMASKPDDWQFWQSAMAKALGCTDKTVRKYTDELIEAGWMSAQATRTDGKFDAYIYTLNEKKLPSVKITVGKNYRLTNKDLEQTNTISNQDDVKNSIRYFIQRVEGAYEALPSPETRDNLAAILEKATPEQIRTVIDRKAAQFHRREIDARIFNMKWLFKPVNFFNELSIAERPATPAKEKKPAKVNGQNSGRKIPKADDWQAAEVKYKNGWDAI